MEHIFFTSSRTHTQKIKEFYRSLSFLYHEIHPLPCSDLQTDLEIQALIDYAFQNKKFHLGGGTVFYGRTHGCELQKVASQSETYPNAFQNLARSNLEFQANNTTQLIVGQHLVNISHPNPNLCLIPYQINRSSKKITRNFSRVKIGTYLLYILKNSHSKTHGTLTVSSFFLHHEVHPFHAQICKPSLL